MFPVKLSKKVISLSSAAALAASVAASAWAGAASADPTPAASQACTIAIDPGHNVAAISAFDPVTGAAMRDYPNGAEDGDVLSVANKVKTALDGQGYKVVLLKEKTTDNISYRDRIKKAEDAGAALAISIHTSVGAGASQVFDQRVGAYREGDGADGSTKKVTFTNADLAAKSKAASEAVAKARTAAEGHDVPVTQNSFNGRAPLWEGNIPIISLISQKIPWVYNEFGVEGEGGSIKVSEANLDKYAKGLTEGLKAALPKDKCTPAAGTGTDTSTNQSSSDSSGSGSSSAAATSAAPANTNRGPGAVSVNTLISADADKTQQQDVPQNIVDGSQAWLKDAYTKLVPANYLVKKLAEAASLQKTPSVEGDANHYRDAVSALSNSNPGWEALVPSKALKLSNADADAFEKSTALVVAKRYTALAKDSSLQITPPDTDSNSPAPSTTASAPTSSAASDSDNDTATSAPSDTPSSSASSTSGTPSTSEPAWVPMAPAFGTIGGS